MASQIIPITNTPANYRLTVPLDGSNYILVFTYNDRTSSWSMDILDARGNPLVNSIAMVPDYPLNYRFNKGQVPGMPPGIFMLRDESGQQRTPDNTNFGQGINLYYIPVADL